MLEISEHLCSTQENNAPCEKEEAKMYTMEELVEKAKKDVAQALDDYGKNGTNQDILQDVTPSFINRYAKDSVYAKRDLRELFRKSPVWNEELQALVINGNKTHNPDYNRIYDLGWNILSNAWHNATDMNIRSCIDYTLEYFSHPDMPEHRKEEALKNIERIAPKAYAPGKKPSRIFKAICQALGVADETAGSDFQRLYAMFADELTSRKIGFKLYVSINPAVYLTMSNPKGDNRGSTLTSCHSFNSTQYSYNNGCSGYGRDNVTFIVFTVDDDHNPESFNNRKTTRQVFAYRPGSGLLLQSRMYNTAGGVYGAAEDSSLYRDLVQREISELENVPNLWKTHHSYDSDYSDFIKEGAGFGGYADWTYDNFDGHICFRADCDPNNVEPLEIGTYGLCVKCGDECTDCMYCDDCKHGDEWCPDCEEYCDEVFQVYDPRGLERYVCQNCRDNNYTRCDHCGDYYDNEVITSVGDQDYCESCLSELCECCEDCGEWHEREDMHRVIDGHGDEVWVCDSCIEDYTFCEECEEYHPNDEFTEVVKADGSIIDVCESCADKYTECPDCGKLVEMRENGTCPHCGKEEDAVDLWAISDEELNETRMAMEKEGA